MMDHVGRLTCGQVELMEASVSSLPSTVRVHLHFEVAGTAKDKRLLTCVRNEEREEIGQMYPKCSRGRRKVMDTRTVMAF